MREAAIISTARTGLAKAIRGGFNKTHGITMGGHTVKHAIAKAGIREVGCGPCNLDRSAGVEKMHCCKTVWECGEFSR